MKLEVDRRRVRDRIAVLEKQLKSLTKSRAQRKSRRSGAGIPIISIVGYTNAGKSTLLNALTSSETHTESKMFATLAGEGINIRLISTSEIRISCVIDEKYAELAVRALHSAFDLDEASS